MTVRKSKLEPPRNEDSRSGLLQDEANVALSYLTISAIAESNMSATSIRQMKATRAAKAGAYAEYARRTHLWGGKDKDEAHIVDPSAATIAAAEMHPNERAESGKATRRVHPSTRMMKDCTLMNFIKHRSAFNSGGKAGRSSNFEIKVSGSSGGGTALAVTAGPDTAISNAKSAANGNAAAEKQPYATGVALRRLDPSTRMM